MNKRQNSTSNRLTGGEVFLIQWSKSKNKTVNVVLLAKDEGFFFVELGKESYWSEYETIIEELQPEEDILEYMDYLEESGEASVKFLGKLNKGETYEKIAFIYANFPELDWRTNKTVTISKAIHTFLKTIENFYTIQQEIHELPIKSGDVLHVHSYRGQSLTKERLTKVGEKYVLQPTNRKVETIMEDEQMTKQELLEYIFALVTEEKRTLAWESVFCPEKAKRLLSLNQMPEKKEVEVELEVN